MRVCTRQWHQRHKERTTGQGADTEKRRGEEESAADMAFPLLIHNIALEPKHVVHGHGVVALDEVDLDEAHGREFFWVSERAAEGDTKR